MTTRSTVKHLAMVGNEVAMTEGQIDDLSRFQRQ